MNYYKILNVSSDATTTEIKSAYRKLARKTHPDVNGGDDYLSSKFAKIAKAYQVLSNPKDRAYYDKIQLKAKLAKNTSLYTEDPKASRAKQRMFEKRYNAIIDDIIAEERQESIALQQIIFPLVALFTSTGFVAVFKPMFWSNSSILGKIIMLTLFILGVLHLLKRIDLGLEHFTYSSYLDDSILNKTYENQRKYSRSQAISFLFIGIFLSITIGIIINSLFSQMMPELFSHTLKLELLFYPPIVVLLAELMHKFALRLE